MSGSNENLPPRVIATVMREVKTICSAPPEGIRVFLQDDSIANIVAEIDGPVGTPFEGGVFRCKLQLGSDFPSAPPKAFFVTKIFHPNVSKVGEICVNTLKKDWKPSHGILHILLVIRCLLIVPNPESALNEDAGKILLERYEEYERRARLMTTIHATPKPSAGAATGAAAAAAKPTGTETKDTAKGMDTAEDITPTPATAPGGGGGGGGVEVKAAASASSSSSSGSVPRAAASGAPAKVAGKGPLTPHTAAPAKTAAPVAAAKKTGLRRL